jgi:hypothetical protein
VTSRWQLFLDPEANDDAREAAWRALRERVRQPILFQLRRRIEGWRLTEDLADEVCERLHDRHAGAGADGSLRACVAAELRALFAERSLPEATDEAFERDWASSLLFAALRTHGRASPATHRLLMRQYDRPEGARPFTPGEMAARLEHPVEEVEELLTEGREEVRELFEEEIRHSVADPSLVQAERDALLPYTRTLFAST